MRRLDLTEDELRVIAMLRGVKNYENLSKSSLIKEINKIKLSEEPKKTTFKKHPKKVIKKSFRRKKDIIKKERGSIEFKLRKEGKKLLEIKKNIKNLLLSRKEKKIPKKDTYKPMKISSAFSDHFVEYKSDSKKDKSISIARYLNNIREHLRKFINDKRTNGEWKIQLIMKINFISSKNFIDTRDMHSKSDNAEIIRVGGGRGDTDEIIKKLFNSLLQRYQKGLEESMRASGFISDYVESLNCMFHKVDLKRSGSYTEALDWIKNKKAKINPQNKDHDKCFQYAIAIALDYDKIENHPERVRKVKPFINQYDWCEINFPSHVNDWKKCELNNKSIALNVLCVPQDEKTIRHACKSKYNLTRENQVILLMIRDSEKWHYLTIMALFNCFHSYRTK